MSGFGSYFGKQSCSHTTKKLNLQKCQAIGENLRPARGVQGHAALENFENLTSQMG